MTVTFTPLFIIGVRGMPRRYATYEQFPQFEVYHQVATFGAMIVVVGMILTISNWIWSAAKGLKVAENPWGSQSLEWTHAPSPPGHGNFEHDPVVTADWTPYNYDK